MVAPASRRARVPVSPTIRADFAQPERGLEPATLVVVAPRPASTVSNPMGRRPSDTDNAPAARPGRCLPVGGGTGDDQRRASQRGERWPAELDDGERGLPRAERSPHHDTRRARLSGVQ